MPSFLHNYKCLCHLKGGIRPWIPRQTKTVPLSTFKQNVSSKKVKIKSSLHIFLWLKPKVFYLLILDIHTQSLHVKHCSMAGTLNGPWNPFAFSSTLCPPKYQFHLIGPCWKTFLSQFLSFPIPHKERQKPYMVSHEGELGGWNKFLAQSHLQGHRERWLTNFWESARDGQSWEMVNQWTHSMRTHWHRTHWRESQRLFTT